MNRTTLDIFFGALAAWLIWKHLVRPKALTLKAKIKDYSKQLKHLYNMNRDVYSEELNSLLQEEMLACKDILKEKDKEVLSNFLIESQKKFKEKIPSRKYEGLAENLDVLLVAFSLAFAVRALFLQPFKIPTSSMQPTLHGVNIYNDNEQDKSTLLKDLNVTHYYYLTKEMGRPAAGPGKSKFRNFLDALYYGQTYADIETQYGGSVDIAQVSIGETIKEKLGVPLLQSFSRIQMNNTSYYIPVPYHKVSREYKNNLNTEGTPLKKSYSPNSKVFKGICEDGDHLFVNRMVYNFREPKRGDIAVFMTKGIFLDGDPLGGQFYIKRLIGLPGDNFRIKSDDKVYLVQNGKEIPLSKTHHESFEKIYSKKNGYHGHWMGRKYSEDGKEKFRPFLDLVQSFDSAFDSSKSIKSLIYHSQQFELIDGKFISQDSEIFFQLNEDLLTLESPTEKRIFKQLSNNSAWGLISIIREDGYEVHFKDDYEEYKLGKNQYFMLGDNSAHSQDSRYWGPVPRKNLMGTAFSVFWPFSKRWGFADNYEPLDKPTVIRGKF